MSDFTSLIDSIREINNIPQGFIPLHAPVFKGKEREYVLNAINSTFVSSVGEYVTLLEKKLEQITGAAKAVACVNGTAAIQVSATLLA